MPPNQLMHSPPRIDCSGMTTRLVRRQSRLEPVNHLRFERRDLQRKCHMIGFRHQFQPAARGRVLEQRAAVLGRQPARRPRRAGTTPAPACASARRGCRHPPSQSRPMLRLSAVGRGELPVGDPARFAREYRAHEFRHGAFGGGEWLERHDRLHTRSSRPAVSSATDAPYEIAEQTHARHIPAAPAEIVDHRRDIARLERTE